MMEASRTTVIDPMFAYFRLTLTPTGCGPRNVRTLVENAPLSSPKHSLMYQELYIT